MNAWRKAVKDYIQMRRRLGFKLRDTNLGLLDFAAFLTRRRAPHITIALALQWAQQKTGVCPAQWARRLIYARGFARYWSAYDSHTQIPPWGLLPFRSGRARPYIYSSQEVQRLLEAAKQLSPAHGLRAHTYYCLLGLLSVTGLRLGEALNLEVQDVDLAQGLLTIRCGKFGKSRLVPIHPSTRQVLADYAARRDRFLAGQPAHFFFVSQHGTQLNSAHVHRTFYDLSRQTGLRGATASYGPRLHDFRHRFAVQTLVRWYRSGQDVERRLPLLSTYLGHVRVANTYWYLSVHPELMGLAVKRLENYWEGQP